MNRTLLVLVALAACNPWGKDADGDGYPEEVDCDDDNAAVNPGVAEVCDGADNDCNGLVDDDDPGVSDATIWHTDGDGDGYGVAGNSVVACAQPAGYAELGDDCDDGVATTNPGATESCANGVDDDCDRVLDCDDSSCTANAACAPVITAITPSAGYYKATHALTIEGAGFAWDTAGTTTVTVGGATCAGVAVVDDETVTCTAPAATGPSEADVVLTNANGTATGKFTYQDCLYAATGRAGTVGSLYCVNPADGSWTTIGAMSVALTGLAVAPDGTAYGTEATDGGDSHLFRIDLTTGAATDIGLLVDTNDEGVHGSVPDITFVGSRLIGWTERGDDPVEIDTSTGAVTKLASVSSPGTANTGLAATSTGTVYLLESGLSGELWAVNASTGATELVTALDGGANRGSSGGATFSNGVLYSLDCDEDGGSSPCGLSTVDVSTGAVTVVSTELPPGLDALAAP